MKKKYLESLQMNISNSYCKKRKRHLHLQYIRMFIKKTGIQMFVWNSAVTRIDNATFYFFNISSKNLKWKQHFYTDTCWNCLLLNMTVWWRCISRRGRGKAREGGTDEQSLSERSLSHDVEKFTVPGSSNLN